MEFENNNDELSLIVYNSPSSPRLIKFSKKTLSFFLWILPLIIVMALAGLIVFSYSIYKFKKRPVIQDAFPVVEMQNENQLLKSRIIEMENLTKELSQRLSSQEDGLPEAKKSIRIPGVKNPKGMNIFTDKTLLKRDRQQFDNSSQKVFLKFNLLNIAESSQKVQGYFFILMLSDSGISYYPSMSRDLLGKGISFERGESFSVARLRPVVADFNRPLSVSTVHFMIVVFSREGDLLMFDETKNYNLR